MMKASKKRGSDDTAERLLPEHLSYLLEDKPLLWNESEEEYDALTGAIFAELDPQGVIETLLANDIVDYIREIRRMRSLRVAAFHAELPGAAEELMEDRSHALLRTLYPSQIGPLVRGAVAGLEVQSKGLASQMQEAHVTPQMVQYEALKSGLNVMTAIEASIIRLERRRDQLLKDLRERRQAFKAMAKGLMERDAAEVVEATVERRN